MIMSYSPLLSAAGLARMPAEIGTPAYTTLARISGMLNYSTGPSVQTLQRFCIRASCWMYGTHVGREDNA